MKREIEEEETDIFGRRSKKGCTSSKHNEKITRRVETGREIARV